MTAPRPPPAAADAERQRADPAARNLFLRIGSALVLAPVVLGAVYLGGWAFVVLCGLAAGGILWEWMRLVFRRCQREAVPAGQSPVALAGWTLAGLIYAGVAFWPSVLLRGDPEYGRTALFFVIAAVWMTDSCAYAVGRTLRGPLLWPRISPNKTWSGAIGGLAGGVAGGVIVAYAVNLDRLAVLATVALALSGCCQAGDLVESAVKRHFGVKDTSGLIPGHGGLMDRLDGLLLSALAAVVIGTCHAGTSAPGRGLLVW